MQYSDPFTTPKKNGIFTLRSSIANPFAQSNWNFHNTPSSVSPYILNDQRQQSFNNHDQISFGAFQNNHLQLDEPFGQVSPKNNDQNDNAMYPNDTRRKLFNNQPNINLSNPSQWNANEVNQNNQPHYQNFLQGQQSQIIQNGIFGVQMDEGNFDQKNQNEDGNDQINKKLKNLYLHDKNEKQKSWNKNNSDGNGQCLLTGELFHLDLFNHVHYQNDNNLGSNNQGFNNIGVKYGIENGFGINQNELNGLIGVNEIIGFINGLNNFTFNNNQVNVSNNELSNLRINNTVSRTLSFNPFDHHLHRYLFQLTPIRQIKLSNKQSDLSHYYRFIQKNKKRKQEQLYYNQKIRLKSRRRNTYYEKASQIGPLKQNQKHQLLTKQNNILIKQNVLKQNYSKSNLKSIEKEKQLKISQNKYQKYLNSLKKHQQQNKKQDKQNYNQLQRPRHMEIQSKAKDPIRQKYAEYKWEQYKRNLLDPFKVQYRKQQQSYDKIIKENNAQRCLPPTDDCTNQIFNQLSELQSPKFCLGNQHPTNSMISSADTFYPKVSQFSLSKDEENIKDSWKYDGKLMKVTKKMYESFDLCCAKYDPFVDMPNVCSFFVLFGIVLLVYTMYVWMLGTGGN